ncbi:hypothetical protein NP568_23825, partial [Vibrio parahaemolyticus]|nr:hypothetical protein [Vibrio parahaemolyticus]
REPSCWACSHSWWLKLRSETERSVAAASTVASVACSGCVGAGAASGGESGVVAGGLGGALEPRRVESEGGDE